MVRLCTFFLCKRQITRDALLQQVACVSVTVCDVSVRLPSRREDVRRHCRPPRSRPSPAPAAVISSRCFNVEGLAAAAALVQGGSASSTALLWLEHLEPLKATSLHRESKMCYISDWPKRFLKPVLLQLSRHQVWPQVPPLDHRATLWSV